jgi:hypothetical protein
MAPYDPRERHAVEADLTLERLKKLDMIDEDQVKEWRAVCTTNIEPQDLDFARDHAIACRTRNVP